MGTILQEKGLDESSGGNAKTLVEVDIGEVPLDLLSTEFAAEDWQVDGGLMQLYFMALEAVNLEIHPWASGEGAATKLKGSVRSGCFRVPLPPAPMCPESTRVTATWHLHVTPSKIVMEC